jgi:hypothetical protein
MVELTLREGIEKTFTALLKVDCGIVADWGCVAPTPVLCGLGVCRPATRPESKMKAQAAWVLSIIW